MTHPFLLTVSLLASLSMAMTAFAQDSRSHNHNHDHAHSDTVDFASLDDGWVALEDVSSAIRAAITADNLDALHDLSSELHAIADSLGKLSGDVPLANQLRFTSSVNQLRTLSDRLHMAHEQSNSAAAQQMVPQLNGVVQLLMVSAESD